jgi:hypothetical protein
MNERDFADIAARYIRFADVEARGRSPLYEAIARGVATDPDILGFLADLPPERRQPNLLLAAVRQLFGTPPAWSGFRQTFLANREAVDRVMRARSTQTNACALRDTAASACAFAAAACADRGRRFSKLVSVARSLWIRLWPHAPSPRG